MQTMADPLERAVRIAPDKVATVCGAERVTFSEMKSRCERLAGHLRELGLAPGDRVAVVSANCHRYLETYQAVPAAGFVLAPFNTRSSEAEIRYAAADSGAKVVITDRPEARWVSAFDHVIGLPEDYEAALANAPRMELGEGITEESLAGLFYTGGTTGTAKGVMLTHRNLIANTWTALSWARLTDRDAWLVMAPLFHTAGGCTVLASVWVGARQVLLPAFDPGVTLDLIEAEGTTGTLAVPTMLMGLIEEQLARPRDVSSLRLLSHGSSPIASEVLRRAHKAFPEAELLHLYGTTETSPIATTMPREEELLDLPQARSCGQPAVGVKVRVVDDDGRELPAGQVGEVTIRGANVMRGYWNKPAETEKVLRNGWYYTGDLGYLDDHSFLFLVDRLKDMIVTGGENVYSNEVEETLYSHPMVRECAVFGVPHQRWGEAVQAVVVPRGKVTAEELIAYCRERIAHFKVPKSIQLRQEPLPKSGAGKILKRELREPYWAGHETRIGN